MLESQALPGCLVDLNDAEASRAVSAGLKSQVNKQRNNYYIFEGVTGNVDQFHTCAMIEERAFWFPDDTTIANSPA